MEDLLAELTIDILSRLPVKTIFHCKCVCKKWRNLLLESSFVDLHLSRSPTGLIIHHKLPTIGSNVFNNPGILKWVEIEDKDDYHHLHHDPLMSLPLNLSPVLQKSRIDLIGSVNGLICLSRVNLDNTYICNPLTREYIILPRGKYFRKSNERVIYGFGVSSMTGEYKVIQTFQNYKNQPSVSEAEVYTLGTGQWRSLGGVPYRLCQSNGSFLNGHYHWIVSDKENALCTFDFDKETFQLFPSPPPPLEEEAIQGSEYHFQCLAILKGCLCKTFQIYINQPGSVSEAEVYTLGTGQWRSLGRVPYRLCQSNGSFLNGHCHWIVSDKENALCTFDFDKETFQLFPSPLPPLEEEAIQGSEYLYECLAILKGCLCVMDTYDSHFTIWVMKEYGIKESWHKEVVINLAMSPDLDLPMSEPLYLIEGLKDGSILTICEDKLWAFYPKNKTIEDTGLFEFSFSSSVSLSGLAYRPSFLKLQNF